jgi:uncharacterized heparinase superfamily protein
MTRLLRTVRHLGAHQIATRAMRMAERAWWRIARTKVVAASAPPVRLSVVGSQLSGMWRLGEEPRTPDTRHATPVRPGEKPQTTDNRQPTTAQATDNRQPTTAQALIAGRFTFLNDTRVDPPWNAPGASHLWRYHLHYFDYLRDLVAAPRDAAYATFRKLVRSWIGAHRTLGGDAWHPYTISLRVVNWCEAAVFFAPELQAEETFARELYDSIAAQVRFLETHLETDVRGNHLLENARALIRAAAFFEGDEAQRWLNRALPLLQREVPEQVLEDGGHFERTPGYHLRVLQVLEDIAVYLPAPLIVDAVARMRAFRDAIVPPNGRLPLFKDTVLPEEPVGVRPGGVRSTVFSRGTPPLRAELSATENCKPDPNSLSPSRWLEASGYAVMRDDAQGDHLIADFGRVCPDYLPAHAHADLFSFELTIGGQPVVVDSGVFEYTAGQWRDWFRSTAAHNTVEIDGRDQSEMWGSFRVGRRARPFDVKWIEGPGFTAISGTHDGYTPLLHTRWIVHVSEARLWFVIDRVTGPAGHTARSRIHLQPDAPFHFTPFGATGVTESEGWLSERFGVKRPNRVLTLTASTPCWFGYAVSSSQDSSQLAALSSQETQGSSQLAARSSQENLGGLSLRVESREVRATVTVNGGVSVETASKTR